MANYLVTSTVFDFEMFAQRAADDKGPRHTMAQIARRLDATILQPDGEGRSLLDGLLGKVFANAEHWAVARRLLARLKDGDIVFCAGQDVGIPLALMKKRTGIDFVLGIHTLHPASGRFAALVKLFGLAGMIDLFTVNDQNKVDILKSKYAVSDDRICVLPEHSDREFFRPGEGTLRRGRPLIASAGLEQRDYRTLAKALEGLDVDVKVCAVSPNASKTQKVSMPDEIPANMEIRYFDFAELRDLYRSADVVVVSVLKNPYSAGLTVLMEAMACHRPVVITLNEGITTVLSDHGVVVGTEPYDADGLRKAIVTLIENPDEANALAERGFRYFNEHHTTEGHVELLCGRLTADRSRQHATC